MNNTTRFVFAVFLAGTHPSNAGEVLGVNKMDGLTTYLYDDGRIVEKSELQDENGGRIMKREWPQPCSTKPSSVEQVTVVHPVVLEGHEVGEQQESVPLLVCDEGTLFVGDVGLRSWAMSGQLPGAERSRLGNVATDRNEPGRVFAAIGNSVWTSGDYGKRWELLATLPEPVQRLSLSIDGQLFAFYEDGVEYGPLETSSTELRWKHKAFESMKVLRRGFYFLAGAGELAWEPRGGQDDEGREWILRPDEEVAALTRRRESWIGREENALAHEYSTRNSTNAGCHWRFERITGPGRSVEDNYWDFDHRPIWINLRAIELSRKKGCTWNMPFSSPYYSVLNYSGKRVTTGGEGQLFVAVPENNRQHPFIRAISLNIVDPKRYLKDLTPKIPDTDKWAIIVQNSKNGGTACEALAHSPTRDRALREKRVYLEVPLRGTNPNCPQRSFSTIACVGASSGTKRSLSATYSVVDSARFAPLSLTGMGECILPVIE